MRFFLLLVLLAAHTQAATYYVRKTGVDTNPGTTGSPWLTINKAQTTMVAGDTVIIGDGDYPEQVQESTAGTAGNLITYQAENRRMVTMRAFRMSASYLKLQGIILEKYSAVGNTWGSAIRVEATSDGCVIDDCEIRDLPGVIAHDFSFNSAEQRITSLSSDFVAAGFEVGSKIYLGASGAVIDGTPLYYVNHDQKWTVATVAPTTMTLTDGSATFEPDAGTNYWAFIRAGTSNDGFAAIECIISGGDGPDDLTIKDCLIKNWAGHAIKTRGTGHLLEGNTLTELRSFRAFDWTGSDHIFRRNYVYNCPNVLWYASDEPLIHPPGTGWYDYQAGMISGFATSGDHQNNLFEDNWFENLENQMGRLDDQLAGAYGVTYQRNVFIGFTAHFSGGRDDMKWLDNTFVRCFGTAPHVLQLGGSAPAQTGYELKRNIFAACGIIGLTESQTRGFYSISGNATAPVTEQNFVTGEELLGFASKSAFTEPTGINGGDPLFVNINDPDGVDNLPWTADDGLKVLPASPAAGIGGGALGVKTVVVGTPVAHFRVTNPIGWWEGVGENFDPDWHDLLPTTRTGPVRPYGTPPSFVGVPLSVTFEASDSISGVGGAANNLAINNYTWNWGDGTSNTSTSSSTVSHTFTTAGDRTVTLTVTNTLGATAVLSSTYRFPGPAKRVPADYATIQAAMDDADPGDTIIVSAGTYTESIRTNVAGNETNRITIEGEPGTIIKQMYVEDPYWTVRNITFQGSVPSFSQFIWIRRGAHYTRVENCVINANLLASVEGITWESPTTRPFGTDAGSNCYITGVNISGVKWTTGITVMGDDNVVENCLLRDFGKADFVQLWGRRNIVRNSTFRHNYIISGNGNHPDFIQTFGKLGFGSIDHIVERNFIDGIENGGITQFEGNLIDEVGYWTIRNNVFCNIGNAASCTIPGIKYYNNTFYKCNYNNGQHALSFGGRIYGKANLEIGPEDSPDIRAAIGAEEIAIVDPDVPSGSIQEGVWYLATLPGSDTLTYNGVTYTGANYDFLGVAGVTTYTESNSANHVGRGVVNFAHGAEAKNNVFLECGNGSAGLGWYAVSTGFGPLTDTAWDGNYVAGPLFAAKTAGTAVYPDPAYNANKFFEPNGINGGDADFFDVATLDFRLDSSSILIDQGVDMTGVVTNDWYGVLRPQDSGFDIGAYEYVADSPTEPPGPTEPVTLTTTTTNATTVTVGN